MLNSNMYILNQYLKLILWDGLLSKLIFFGIVYHVLFFPLVETEHSVCKILALDFLLIYVRENAKDFKVTGSCYFHWCCFLYKIIR